MAERITISFDIDKEELLNIFSQDDIRKTFEEFLKYYYGSYLELHKQNIKRNMDAIRKKNQSIREIEEEEMEKIVFKHLLYIIGESDIERIKIEVAKATFKESLSNGKKTKIAIKEAFIKPEVILVAEDIWKKILARYFLCAIHS